MKSLRRSNLLITGAVATLALALTACAGPSAPPKAQAPDGASDLPASATIDRIKDRGEITVGVLSQLPWIAENPGNSDDPWFGPTWDQAKMIAKELGVKLVPVPVSHTTKVTAVQTGQVDITIAPLDATPARLEVIEIPTNSLDGQCFVALKSNTNIKSDSDLEKEGLTLAYPLGGAQDQQVPPKFPNMELKPQQLLPGVNWATSSTLTGATDLTIFPGPQVYMLLKAHPDKFNVFPKDAETCLSDPYFPFANGWGVQKGDEGFVKFIQGVMDKDQKSFDTKFFDYAKKS